MSTSGTESPVSLLSARLAVGDMSLGLQPICLFVGGHPHIWEMAASALRLAGFSSVEHGTFASALGEIGRCDALGRYPAVIVLDPSPGADGTQAFLAQVQAAWTLPLPLPSLVRILADHWRPARIRWRDEFVLPKPFRVRHFLGVIEHCMPNPPF